jgi:hypothetical protein
MILISLKSFYHPKQRKLKMNLWGMLCQHKTSSDTKATNIRFNRRAGSLKVLKVGLFLNVAK